MRELLVFPWNDLFAVGIPHIDEQHHRLVDLLNTLARSVASNAEAPQLDQIFRELAEYATYHFESEETIWSELFAGDVWESEHRESHRSFVEEVGRMRSEGAHRPLPEVLKEILGFLTHWLIFHILDSDRRMANVGLAIRSGLSLEAAKQAADKGKEAATRVLIQALLSMYDDLSSRTLEMAAESQARQRVEASLAASHHLNRELIRCMPDGFLVLGADGAHVEVNEALCQMTGFTREELLGRAAPYPYFPPEEHDNLRRALQRTMNNELGELGEFELSFRRKTGERFPVIVSAFSILDAAGAVVSRAATVKDITERKLQEEHVRQLALFDPLTHLPNRRLLHERLGQAMITSKRTGSHGVVMFLDLDNFKPLNDAYGHAAGDLLLIEVANRLKTCLREIDTVARFGGDEFVIMLVELSPDPAQAVALAGEIAERVRRAIAEPYFLVFLPDGAGPTRFEHGCTASIGAALFVGDQVSQEDIILRADTAMYQAKSAGRDRIQFHAAPLSSREGAAGESGVTVAAVDGRVPS